MPPLDSFEDLARFYDPMMAHVNYDRWYTVTGALAELLPRPFAHLDAACGTCTLLKRLRRIHWHSAGIDLSRSMLHVGAKSDGPMPVAVADLRALPFASAFDYVTCLFDSVNFLLHEEDLRACIAQFASALRPGGLLYFDVVTERMILSHYAGQKWTEKIEEFETTWDCIYDRKSLVAASSIRVNSGPASTIRERVYSRRQIENALALAGFEVLGVLDAEKWRPPSRKTVRMDFVAVRGSAQPVRQAFSRIAAEIAGMLA